MPPFSIFPSPKSRSRNMTAARKVSILAKWTAVSSTPVKPGKAYPLSVLDHAMAAHTLHMVFYYRTARALDREQLNKSLAEVLSHYPAITGRLARDGDRDGKWVVKCNDAGVRMHDAKVGVTLDEWFESASAEDEKELAYWEPVGEDYSIWSPFYIQITEFKDNAFAIGLSLPHMHCDAACAALFVKAWGDSHRRSYIVHPPFFHPPGLLPRAHPNLSTPTARLLSLKSSSGAPTASPRRMSSASFRFSDRSISSFLSATDVECTPFDVLAALFWTSVAKKPIGRAALTICVDFRKSMHAPLPYGFYGNALHFSRMEADLSSGPEATAAAVGRHVAGLEEEEYWSGVDWFGSSNGEAAAFRMYGPELTCVKMDHHSLAYGAAFEEGPLARPAHVSCWMGGAEGEGVVVVMPAAEDGMARTVAATLPEEVMERVCKDEDILRHGPTIMFRGACN